MSQTSRRRARQRRWQRNQKKRQLQDAVKRLDGPPTYSEAWFTIGTGPGKKPIKFHGLRVKDITYDDGSTVSIQASDDGGETFK